MQSVAGNTKCASASTTFASGTSTTVSIGSLAGLAYDATTDSLLIAAPDQARVLRLSLADSRISSVLGDGRRRAVDTTLPQEHSVDGPEAILVSESWGALVADRTSFTVLRLADGKVVLFAGYWPQLSVYPSAIAAPLLRPRGLCIDHNGSLLVVDAGAERILSLGSSGQLTSIAGRRSPTGYSSGDSGAATEAQIGDPDRIACAPDGSIYFGQGNQIRLINPQGVISTFLSVVRTDSGATGLNDPAGMVIDPSGNLVFSEAGSNRVIRRELSSSRNTVIAGTGRAGFTGDGGRADEARLDRPGDLAYDSKGNLLIADRGNRRIRRVSPDGTITTIAGSDRTFSYIDISGELATDVGFQSIDGLAVDSKDNIYISEQPRVSVIDTAGRVRILTGFVGEADDGTKFYLDGAINGCDGLAVDSAGRVYFSLREDGRVMVAVPPGVNEGAVVSSTAFGGLSSVAPGTWIEIYGSGLAASTRQWSTADFAGTKAPTSLDGVKVSIGNQSAFVAYISPGQVNAQVPSNVTLGQQQVIVTTSAGGSVSHQVTVNSTQPGLLSPAAFRISGKQYAVASISGESTYAAPSGAIPGASSRPVRPGETIVLYGVGFGQVVPQIDAGTIDSQPNSLAAPVQFFVGQTAAFHSYAGLAPGVVGLYQFNVVVPLVATSEAIQLSFTLGGVKGEQTLFIAVE